MRLPVAAVIAFPIRSALLLSPGRPFGQLVAILNSRMSCEIAGVGKAAALAITPARSMRLRRLTVASQDCAWSVVSGLQREAPIVAGPLEIVMVRRKVTTGALLCRLARGCQCKESLSAKVHQDADPPHLVEVLSKCRERLRRSPAEECDELAPFRGSHPTTS